MLDEDLEALLDGVIPATLDGKPVSLEWRIRSLCALREAVESIVDGWFEERDPPVSLEVQLMDLARDMEHLRGFFD